MSDERTIIVRETASSTTIARDETTGIEANGNNVPTALYTLAEKLEKELLGWACIYKPNR